ncbi:MAG: CAP domain-containing protein [Micromonosporaceae bacterium]
MLSRISRVTLFALLCAGIVVGSWLLVPARADHRANPGPGAASTQAKSPEQGRDERTSRNQRLKSPSPPPPSPSPKPRPSPRTSPPLTGDAALEAAVIDLVNAERDKSGCGAVRLEVKLRTASRRHSADMAAHNEMSHTGSDGSSPWDRAGRAGYDHAMSENVAMGYRTAEAVMEGWMNSKGHRDNILNCEAKAVGVGLARSSDGTPYWTQMFGRV